MIDYIGYTLTSLGALSLFLSALSAVRFPDFYSRLNGVMKFAALGLPCLTLGILTLCGFSSVGVKALLCFGLALVLLPSEAQALIRCARKSGIKMPGEID